MQVRIAGLGLILALGTLTLLLADTARWLWQVPFAGQERRLNLLLLLLFAGLFARRLAALRSTQGNLLRWPQPLRSRTGRLAPAVLMGALLAHALTRRAIGESTPTAALALLGTYGGLGLFLSPAAFRAGWTGLLLLLASLPFAALAEGYAGLLARIFTADMVQQILSALRIAALPVSSILILDRGIAHIDIPCSGLRGLWSGALAYLLLTWLDRRRLGVPWLLGLALMQALLVVANITRVFSLVVLTHVAMLHQLADRLHVPLGLFGFALCVAFAFVYLRTCVPHRDPAATASTHADPDPAAPVALPTAKTAAWLLPTLAIFFLGLWAAQRRAATDDHKPTPASNWLPAHVQPVPQPLTESERTIYERFGAHAEKYRVRGGSLIVVHAPTLTAFRAHHPPEVCLLAEGLQIVQAAPVSVGPQALARRLLLQEREASGFAAEAPARQLAHRTGIYWFQSAESTTPDILLRIVRQLGSRRPWVLVTLLSDERPSTLSAHEIQRADASFQRVASSIHAAIAHTFFAAPPVGDPS